MFFFVILLELFNICGTTDGNGHQSVRHGGNKLLLNLFCTRHERLSAQIYWIPPRDCIVQSIFQLFLAKKFSDSKCLLWVDLFVQFVLVVLHGGFLVFRRQDLVAELVENKVLLGSGVVTDRLQFPVNKLVLEMFHHPCSR